jgi:hypothetical protein
MSEIVESLGAVVPELERCFRTGGGVPYAAFRPQFTHHMDDAWRRIYDEQLIAGFLAAVPGLTERLVFEVMLQGWARSNTTSSPSSCSPPRWSRRTPPRSALDW